MIVTIYTIKMHSIVHVSLHVSMHRGIITKYREQCDTYMYIHDDVPLILVVILNY